MKKIAFILATAMALPLASATANAQQGNTQSRNQISFQRGGVQLSFRIGQALRPVQRSPYSDQRYRSSHSSHSCDHDRNRYRQPSSHSCGSDRIRLIAGYQRGKGTRPSGWHDKSWFRKKGYNLDNYVHIHEKSGVVHYGRNVRRSSHDSQHSSHSRDRQRDRGHDDHRGHGH